MTAYGTTFRATRVLMNVVSGIAVVVDNRRRVAAHPPNTAALILKTALTGPAIPASAAGLLSPPSSLLSRS